MKIKQLLLKLLTVISATVTLKSDVRDFLLFSGLFFVGYGLYLYAPWLGYTVGGGLLMIIAIIMKD
jgi:hypothetical protein